MTAIYAALNNRIFEQIDGTRRTPKYPEAPKVTLSIRCLFLVCFEYMCPTTIMVQVKRPNVLRNLQNAFLLCSVFNLNT